ncbi:gamma-secretase subunit APH-1A-like isoform X2 [Stegostoma tigrinum]|uniref:gamma-secretase subunit APH-1A-like isoform X2 n=1 Tax=Stegostoma tigrinum TaxID=3053191 RepID=UPI0028709B40|nr:gamma-secretase subunit APH-1A-like isoform X2 [Stegostoma tigrinum]
MSAAVFFGCTFIAFGPAFGLLLFTVAGDPLRVIILVAGSFFWLVSLLFSSLLWFVAVQLGNKANAGVQHGLLMMGAGASVLLQEAFRFAYYKLLKKADQGLAAMSEDGRSPISIGQMAYVSGLAFGVASGAFSVINVLSDSLGPGVVGIHGDSPYFFLTSAFLTMAVVLLHTSWGVVFFDACEKRRWLSLMMVIVTHLLTSGLTFLNPRYEWSLPLIYGLTIATGGWAFLTAGGSVRNVWRCVTCSRLTPTFWSIQLCSHQLRIDGQSQHSQPLGSDLLAFSPLPPPPPPPHTHTHTHTHTGHWCPAPRRTRGEHKDSDCNYLLHVSDWVFVVKQTAEGPR